MENPSTRHIEISWLTLWRIFIFVALIALLYFARSAFAVFFLGVVISLGIEPFVAFLSAQLHIKRLVAVLAALLVVVAGIGFAAYLIIPVLLREVSGFIAHFTQTVSLIPGLSIPSFNLQNTAFNLDQVWSLVGSGGSLSGFVMNFLGGLILFFGAVVITLYLSIEKEGTEKMLRVILPAAYERPVLAVFEGFKKKMRRWLGTQVVLSAFIGIAVGLGMWLIGVRYPLVLGVLAALLEVVPIIGPIVTGAVAFLVAASDSLVLAVYAVIFFFVLQQFENHVLVPIVMGKSMRVHPVVVVVSLLAGGEIAGFVGIILSVPIAVLVQEIFDYMAERKGRKNTLEF